MKSKILVVDDEDIIRLTLKEGLSDLGHEVETAVGSADGLMKVKVFRPDIILLDMRLKGEDGLDLAQKIKRLDAFAAIIIMTAYADIKTAIRAIRLGALDYIKKPLDLEEIEVTISKALANRAMKKKLLLYEKKEDMEANEFICGDPAMDEVVNRMNILAGNDHSTVLIRGETGTGKEGVASYIHRNGPRKESAMVSINCSAIPEQLLESELFGFEKHSFTGAGTRKQGLLELAHGGTLFLDELGEMSLGTQAKLLRVIERKRFKRIGGLEEIEIDIRIIAATNKNLEESVKRREFREDLFYRLNVVPIAIPPLRERPLDVELLSQHFLERYAKKFRKRFTAFSREARDLMAVYAWPGNVRELKNLIERIVILNDGEILEAGFLPPEMQSGMSSGTGALKGAPADLIDEGFSLEEEVARLEKHYIAQAMRLAEDNHSKAAKLLGISRHALNRRIEKHFKEEEQKAFS